MTAQRGAYSSPKKPPSDIVKSIQFFVLYFREAAGSCRLATFACVHVKWDTYVSITGWSTPSQPVFRSLEERISCTVLIEVDRKTKVSEMGSEREWRLFVSS